MNVFITGGTGFVGRALVLRLRRDGDTVTVLTRSPKKARTLLGLEAEYLDVVSGDAAIRAALDRSSAVVNLAGEPLIGERWTEEKKRRIRASRVDLTNDLVGHLESLSARPRVLVSTSAVGFYGNRGDDELTEDSVQGDGFLARLCRDWESAALRAKDFGVRVVTPRIGIVLGRGDGALSKMLPAYRAGFGGPLGRGDQFFPWIHVEDLVELLVQMIRDDRYEGAFNATGPMPVRQRHFAKALGAELSRPAILPVPAMGLKLLFGEAASVLLDSQRAVPRRAVGLGFQFAYSSVESALANILGKGTVTIRSIDEAIPDSSYLAERPPSFVLTASETFARPIEEIFQFFSRPENLGLITPPGMKFCITSSPETIVEGSEINYSLQIGPVPISWTTRIDVWEDGFRFVDSQTKGPYASWWHEHRFETQGSETHGSTEPGPGTVMTDRVFYAPPLGPLGKIANSLFIEGELRQVFGYRSAIMRLRFG